MELARCALNDILYNTTFEYHGLRGGAPISESIRAAMLLDIARGIEQL